MKRGTMVALGILLVSGALMTRADDSAGPTQNWRGPGRSQAQTEAQLKTDLGLTDSQVTDLRKLHEETRATARRDHLDLRVARQELELLLSAKELDSKAIDAKLRQMSDLHTAGLRRQVEREQALRKILTPEQRARLRALRGTGPRARGEAGVEGARGRRGHPAGPGGRRGFPGAHEDGGPEAR